MISESRCWRMLIAVAGFSSTLASAALAADATPSGEARVAHSHGAVPLATDGAWTDLPLLVQAGRGGERGTVMLTPRNLEVVALAVRDPGQPGAVRQVVLSQGRAAVTPLVPGEGGFHWISAREESADAVRVASTVWSFGSKGASPQAMLDLPKEDLEILPRPASQQYRENGSWDFIVRYQGQPLAAAELRLETENGSQQQFVSDQHGVARIVFPPDFPAAKLAAAEDLRRLQARFVLAVERHEAGRHYLTAFNGTYSPDRMRERSLLWGGGFALLGMVLAVPLLWRKEKNGA